VGEECPTPKIQLRGKEGKEALAKFTGIPVEQQHEVRKPFNQENLLECSDEFHMVTDEVYLSFLLV